MLTIKAVKSNFIRNDAKICKSEKNARERPWHDRYLNLRIPNKNVFRRSLSLIDMEI